MVKMKIGGADLKTSMKRSEAVLKFLGGRGENLCVEVKGRFDLNAGLLAVMPSPR
jgi:hypothetical protein